MMSEEDGSSMSMTVSGSRVGDNSIESVLVIGAVLHIANGTISLNQ